MPGDYRVLLDFAAAAARRSPILIGVSEGAGLSVLAAADSRIHAAAAGVVGVGLPAINELGWRWRDSLIYLTHGVPNEPTFSTAPVIGKVAPLPLAAIHSTHDEFVSSDEARQLLAQRGGPEAAVDGRGVGPPVQRQSRRVRRAAARGPRPGSASGAAR